MPILARPELKGRLCMRSGSAIYNLSLLGALIENGARNGRGLGGGRRRQSGAAPQGGDIDQIKAVAAGECAVTLANTYYFVRPVGLGQGRGQGGRAKGAGGLDQDGRGAHANIRRGG